MDTLTWTSGVGPVQPNFSPRNIADLEQEIGRRLPSAFKALLPDADGGRPSRNVLHLMSGDGQKSRLWISTFLLTAPIPDSGELAPLRMDSIRYARDLIEDEHPACVPFARDPSDSYFAFDYSKGDKDNPAIVFLDSENSYELVELTDTFEEFLDYLESDEP